MKNFVLLIVIFSFVSIEAFSQNASFGLQTGIATNSMKGLKHINESIRNDLPFDAKTISDFPPYFYYRPYIGIQFTDNISFGFLYSFFTTGSRVSAADYSGEYRFDMIVNSSGPGIFYEVNLMTDRAVHLSIYSIFGASFSKLKMKESLILMDSLITHESYTFIADGFFLEPGIKFMYPIKNFGVGINLSYSFGIINKPFYLSDNKNVFLADPDNGEKLKPQWNGFRIGLTISYFFNLNTSSFAGL